MARTSKKRNSKVRLKTNKNDTKTAPKEGWYDRLSLETKKSILAVISFITASIFVLSFIGKGGVVGSYIYKIFSFLFGSGYFFAPIVFVLVGFSLLGSGDKKMTGVAAAGGILFMASSLALMNILSRENLGGFIGKIVSTPLLRLFDFWASLIIITGAFIISLVLIFDMPILNVMERVKRKEEEPEDKQTEQVERLEKNEESEVKTILEDLQNTIKSIAKKDKSEESKEHIIELSAYQEDGDYSVEQKAGEIVNIFKRKESKKYIPPPLNLLQGDEGKPSSGDIRANMNIIKRTLENFGIVVDMDQVSIGPTVTQYTLKPAEGIKLSKITNLHNDLALALAAHPIRIEAPIPGKSLVGIEVPNKSTSRVGLRSLLENDFFRTSPNPLLFALGRDVTGQPVYADLATMPHLLISGSTGSGKSVCIHTIMMSLIYRNSPEVLNFIIVDPKRVELSLYNDIPHLRTPVVTDAKNTVKVLNWAVKEMERRYELLASRKTRDITMYNTQVAKIKDKDQNKELLPYIAIVIDELADLMSTYPKQIEAGIVRLAQMARAVGIHLVVATQRPSVEVLTGLIKANITSRIAFQVASQVDSRTVLDMAGAEKLLGNGDMLFLSGNSSKPRRIQGSFVSEKEVRKVVDFLREAVGEPEYDDSLLDAKVEDENSHIGIEGDLDEYDPKYEMAKEVVINERRASASYLQRRLGIGYARAARLLDMMEQEGIVGPGQGAKPREIFVPPPQQDQLGDLAVDEYNNKQEDVV